MKIKLYTLKYLACSNGGEKEECPHPILPLSESVMRIEVR